jgi:uncharacterized repeat protein (TIGR03803 family)
LTGNPSFRYPNVKFIEGNGGGNMIKSSSWKPVFLACVFCAATAIAARAQTFNTLASFNYTNGYMPWSTTLIQGTDGNFYGTTVQGGAYGMGTVFRVTPTGDLTALYSFCAQTGCPDGREPNAGLVQGADENFYGTTGLGGANNDGTIFKITPEGQLTTLHVFNGTDGSAPGSLIQASNGNFYGGTGAGGNTEACPTGPGCGTIFEITAAGEFTTLHTFDGSDGAGAAVIQGNDGNFYGVTGGGGLDECPPYPGCGTVFKMTPAGNLTTLYTFHGTDGWMPGAALVQATNGNFYGTTMWGGATNNGTIFEIAPQGELTTLYSFNFTDGGFPTGPLIQATDGNLYGTTTAGGLYGWSTTWPEASGDGTIFQITLEGALTTRYNFPQASGPEPWPDGVQPWGGLVQATDGNFYGTTNIGGTGPNCGTGGCGTVFSLSVGLDPFVKTEPTSGEVGATIIILGTDLTGATSVTFNGKAAEFTVVSSTEIKAAVPAAASSGKVQVATPHGTLSSSVPFRVGLQRARHGRFPTPNPL